MTAITDKLSLWLGGDGGFLPRLLITVLNMSLSASIVIVCVLLARLLLRRAPRVFSYLLWSVVLFRLICPFSFESRIAIVPGGEYISTQPSRVQSAAPDSGSAYEPVSGDELAALPDSGGAAAPAGDAEYVPSGSASGVEPSPSVPAEEPSLTVGEIVACGWLGGALLLAVCSLISLARIKLRLREALCIGDNIYICDRIDTPFVMGVIRPGIYLPSGLGTNERSYILLHERHHIKRLDHVIKLLAFSALCIHWFNPLVWLAYALAMRDMEMSCDEAVLRVAGADIRTDYSLSLLALASGKRVFLPSPLAFGESDTSVRIKNVVRYKKPAALAVAVAVVLVAASVGSLACSRGADVAEPDLGDDVGLEQALDESEPSDSAAGITQVTPPQVTLDPPREPTNAVTEPDILDITFTDPSPSDPPVVEEPAVEDTPVIDSEPEPELPPLQYTMNGDERDRVPYPRMYTWTGDAKTIYITIPQELADGVLAVRENSAPVELSGEIGHQMHQLSADTVVGLEFDEDRRCAIYEVDDYGYLIGIGIAENGEREFYRADDIVSQVLSYASGYTNWNAVNTLEDVKGIEKIELLNCKDADQVLLTIDDPDKCAAFESVIADLYVLGPGGNQPSFNAMMRLTLQDGSTMYVGIHTHHGYLYVPPLSSYRFWFEANYEEQFAYLDALGLEEWPEGFAETGWDATYMYETIIGG